MGKGNDMAITQLKYRTTQTIGVCLDDVEALWTPS